MTPSDRLWQRVTDRARSRGMDPRLALPVAAAAVTLLGVGQPLHRVFVTAMSTSKQPAATVGALLNTLQQARPYLDGHLEPLLNLLRDTTDPEVNTVVGEMLSQLANGDLPALAEQPDVAGDVLGPLYTSLTAPADRSARGAFYTPPALASLMAMLVDPQPGESCYEPCVGTGGMVIAAIRAMRGRGQTPETVRWVIGDIDRLALAIAGCQLAAHGMVHVHLVPGNALDPEVATAIPHFPTSITDGGEDASRRAS